MTHDSTLTGSGPATWRHDGTPAGIADLVGNVWEWVAGLRLVNGEIQIIPNNDTALASTDMSASSPLWKAIRASDGALVSPGTSGTLKYDIDPNKSYSNDDTAQDLGPLTLRTTTQTPPAGWERPGLEYRGPPRFRALNSELWRSDGKRAPSAGQEGGGDGTNSVNDF